MIKSVRELFTVHIEHKVINDTIASVVVRDTHYKIYDTIASGIRAHSIGADIVMSINIKSFKE